MPTRDELIASGTVLPLDLSNLTGAVTWRTPAGTYERPASSDTLTLASDAAAPFQAIVEAVGPVVADAAMWHLVPVGLNAAENWPEATGYSRDLLSFDWTATPGALVARLTAGAEYTTDIEGGALARRLLVDPWHEATDAMAVDIAIGIASEADHV